MNKLIRQENFSISEIQDAVHAGQSKGMISFEKSFVNLIRQGIIDIDIASKYLEADELRLVKEMLGGIVSDVNMNLSSLKSIMMK